MKPSTHPAFVFLLAAFHLVAAVQEPPNLPRIPPRTPTANNQRPSQNGMGPRERVIAASLLPWRDPQPVLPRSGCALDESEAIQIEKIYQQLRDDFSVASTGPSRGIEIRRAQQRFYERISGFVQSNPNGSSLFPVESGGA
jgi:hypothetical protein